MNAVGIGGVLLFNITQGIPNGDVIYDSPEHHELLTHAAKECERLGMTFGVHNCDGWSSSGGPWISPEHSMKMVVTSTQVIAGGRQRRVKLKQPTMREGLWKDISVLAYPALTGEKADALNVPMVSSSDGNLDLHIIRDGKAEGYSQIRGEGSWIQFEYAKPTTIYSTKAFTLSRHSIFTLQASDNGKDFREIRELNKVRTSKSEWAIDDHFDGGVKAKFFRVVLNRNTQLKNIELSQVYTTYNTAGRIAIARTNAADLGDIGAPEASQIIDPSRILNLTADLEQDGWIELDLPEGNWTVMRIGYTSTGARNHPASTEGRGLEADKLSKAAVKVHYDAFVGEVVENARELAPNAMQYAEIDSYEMGGQNWTDGFGESFKQHYGYDLTLYFPLFGGRFVTDAETSENVLYDLREHIARLFTENYFGYFTELAHADGIQTYLEPYGFGPFSDLDAGATCDIPMGEFWMNRDKMVTESAVSSAHIYNKPIISAEAFTSQPEINWSGHPAMAKHDGDKAWARGINEIMFHRFTHQANTNVIPGMTMNRWGFHVDRTQTWWENAGAAWFKYLARGSFMLRQGYPVADLLLFVGDGAPSATFSRADYEPSIPRWINTDNVNADVLINHSSLSAFAKTRQELVLESGASYRAVVLKNTGSMRMETLQRLEELAGGGLLLLGEVPSRLAGYHDEATRQKFAALRMSLSKKIMPLQDWELLYQSEKWPTDGVITKRDDIDVAHRRIGDKDVYFLYNPDSSATQFDVSFGVSGKVPELWDPMTGKMEDASQYASTAFQTRVLFDLEAKGSTFVVFQRDQTGNAPGISATTAKKSIASLDVSGPWKLQFPQLNGEVTSITFSKLQDWSKTTQDEIKYFSGTATYSSSFDLSAQQLATVKGTSTYLNLGEVAIAAEVRINGENAGIAWMPPFRLEVGQFLKTGTNTLEIEVTNTWANRLIGDEQYPRHFDGYKLDRYRNGNYTKLQMVDWYRNNEPAPQGPRQTFTTADFYSPDDPLHVSGLLGPVRITFK